MTARQDTYELMRDLEHRGIQMTYEDVNTLRRAQITLHRWAELECGDGDNFKSWAIERNDKTGIPYMAIYGHREGSDYRYRIPDREAGALRRVAAVCARYGLHFYHQTDPRGSALRIGTEPMQEGDYTRGIAV